MHINVSYLYNLKKFKLDVIKKLCENGLPVEKYFDLCANYILEYEIIRHSGVIPEISYEENYKNDNSLKDNKNNNDNISSIEDQIKNNLEVKNEDLKK